MHCIAMDIFDLESIDNNTKSCTKKVGQKEVFQRRVHYEKNQIKYGQGQRCQSFNKERFTKDRLVMVKGL